MSLIKNYVICLECPYCKKEIEVMPATKEQIKIILKKLESLPETKYDLSYRIDEV